MALLLGFSFICRKSHFFKALWRLGVGYQSLGGGSLKSKDLAVYSPFLISIRPEYLVLVTVENFGQRVWSDLFS